MAATCGTRSHLETVKELAVQRGLERATKSKLLHPEHGVEPSSRGKRRVRLVELLGELNQRGWNARQQLSHTVDLPKLPPHTLDLYRQRLDRNSRRWTLSITCRRSGATNW